MKTINCRYLTGANIKPDTVAVARTLIGRDVKYLRECDFDKSGRGMFFPQTGTVTNAYHRWIEIDGSAHALGTIREMVAR